MAQAIEKLTPARRVAPPEQIAKLFQSGAIKDEELARFFIWLDNVVQNKTTFRNNGHTVENLIGTFFNNGRVSELVSKARLQMTDTTVPNGHIPIQPKQQNTTTSTPVQVEVKQSIMETISKKSLVEYLKLDKPIVFFALHTAGRIGPERKIVEIALVKINPNGKKEKLSYKINPEMEIQKEEIEYHGITDEDVGASKAFRKVAQDLNKFLEGCNLGGYNILTFDLTVLTKEFEKAGIKFTTADRAIIDPSFIYHKKVRYEPGKKRNLVDAYKLYCESDLQDAVKTEVKIAATENVLKGQFEMYGDLTRDVNELSDYCLDKNSDNVDASGKFVWKNGEVIFAFSQQHKGDNLRDVIEKDRGFINWMLSAYFPEDVKELLRNALNGIYPKQDA